MLVEKKKYIVWYEGMEIGTALVHDIKKDAIMVAEHFSDSMPGIVVYLLESMNTVKSDISEPKWNDNLMEGQE